jgi:hypothetical protein
VERRRAAGRLLAARFTWERVLAPLVEFCRRPAIDATKERFAFRPPTVAPPEGRGSGWGRRLRRRLGVFPGGVGSAGRRGPAR